MLSALYPEAAFLARIGSGAYGEVWLARFPDGDFRAVKLVAADSSRAEAAARERRAVRLLHSLADPANPSAPLHPALLPVLDVREAPGSPAFAYSMPLADSLRPSWTADPATYRPRTLATELLARRALPIPECLALAESLASALDFLQRRCLVHRDLKPSNILYLSGRPVLADFGLLADTREAASAVGTPGYVPAEQHGRFSADLYSLGVLLAEAATGRPPSETGFAPVEEADTDHPRYPRFLALVRRAADPNPARRPQTAAAFLKELRAFSAPSPWRKRLRWTLIAIGLYLLWGLVLCIVEEWRTPPQSQPSPPPSLAPSVSSVPSVPSPTTTNPPSPPPNHQTTQPPNYPTSPTSRPVPDLAYLTPYLAYRNAFLQFYTDRIRFGLPRGDLDPEDFSLLLVYPEDTPREPWMHPSPAVPACVLPLETASTDDTPPTFATDPALPRDARTSRRSRTAIALLPLADPYPEAVFLFPVPPDTLDHWLSTHPSAAFDDLEAHWHTSQPFSAI